MITKIDENRLAAIKALIDTKDQGFDMGSYFKPNLESRWSECCVNASVKYINKLYGYYPCGSVTCLAGTIQFNFDQEGIETALGFSAKFLGINLGLADYMFTCSNAYNTRRLGIGNVQKQEVVDVLIALYNTGKSWNRLLADFSHVGATILSQLENVPLRPEKERFVY